MQAGSTVRTDNGRGVATRTVLVGDIGGTNARLSVASIGADQEVSTVYEKWYATKDYPTFLDVLDAAASEQSVQAASPSVACFAVAGPVQNGRGQMTNLNWTIDGQEIERKYGWRVAVMNDFEAQGYGVLELQDSDLHVVNEGCTVQGAPKIVIGPGTGLGQAQLMWDDGLHDYRVWPSEGSHADFAPRGSIQVHLRNWVVDGLGFCEVEHVACGSGIERIYAFLTNPDSFTAGGKFPKKARDISREALDGSDPDAVAAVDLMLSIVGAEAGHMALRSLARGGVYIAGGITPKLLDRVKTGVMQEAFLHKGSRFHNLLKDITVSVVMQQDVGLLGARRFAIRLLNSQ
ncbi:unnamed protein product [Ostreobium quekettii]|uniref:Glucokinase n=1 Tax=Ostreobium quekettii TaxID=121088 RepID=A0A8S1J7L5_9CHLO|nr:unnamed protein product [Ostreobium quekettii]|eukprot:evm.model.scf_35.5 EVM.evm.TU.scf_35.5   scf_35:43705-47476(+)